MSKIQISVSGIDGITAFIYLPKTNKHLVLEGARLKDAKKAVKEYGLTEDMEYIKDWVWDAPSHPTFHTDSIYVVQHRKAIHFAGTKALVNFLSWLNPQPLF